MYAISVNAEDPAGTSHSKPNVSSGYDFYDADGNKVGSSTLRIDGGYDYYDKHGNLTGHLVVDPETGEQSYEDAENVSKGSLGSDPYGGYRFDQEGEDSVTSTQSQVRKNYEYADPYGKGLETLSPDVIQGKDTEPATGATAESGLATELTGNSGLASQGSEATETASATSYGITEASATTTTSSIETTSEATGLETQSSDSGLQTTSRSGSGLDTS